jgi:hypothetical protein
MPIQYKDCAGVVIPAHVCDDCAAIEGGRIRGAAFIKKDVEFTDPADPTEWIAGIEAGDIIIIPTTTGTFDGGSEVMGTGFGDIKEVLNGYDFVANISDPAYKQNADFWNKIKGARNFKFAYRTETQVHITKKIVSIIPKNPVEEDLTSQVTWKADVRWTDVDLPEPVDGTEVIPAVFTCFEVTAPTP